MEGRDVQVDRQTQPALIVTSDPLLVEPDARACTAGPVTILDDEHAQLRARMQRLEAELAQVERLSSVRKLVDSIAQEVKRPLATIVTSADTSMRWLDRSDPHLAKIRQLTARISECARQATEVIDRFREAAQAPESGRARLCINDVIRRVSDVLGESVAAVGIVLHERFAGSLPQVSGHEAQLRDLLSSIIANSVEALSDHDGDRTITIATQAAGDEVCVEVRDSGPGFTGDHDFAFEGLFTTKPGRLGLGLTICRTIIAIHGGSITAGNGDEGGAVVQFRLPALPPSIGVA